MWHEGFQFLWTSRIACRTANKVKYVKFGLKSLCNGMICTQSQINA